MGLKKDDVSRGYKVHAPDAFLYNIRRLIHGFQFVPDICRKTINTAEYLHGCQSQSPGLFNFRQHKSKIGINLRSSGGQTFKRLCHCSNRD